MTHDDIITWANENVFNVQPTTQGTTPNESDHWPVTLVTGDCSTPLATAQSLFDTPDRKHVPVEGQAVYGFDDDRVILVVVDDGTQWLHLMLYDDADTYEQGWKLQAPDQVEPTLTREELIAQAEALLEQARAMT